MTLTALKPREATERELLDLAEFMESTGEQEAQEILERSAVAVFEDYITDGPGYGGKTLVVLWPAGFCEIYGWNKDGVLEGRDG